jgi:hypothetical protein
MSETKEFDIPESLYIMKIIHNDVFSFLLLSSGIKLKNYLISNNGKPTTNINQYI